MRHLIKPKTVKIGSKYVYVGSFYNVGAFSIDTGELYQQYEGHVRSVTSVDGDCSGGLVLSGSGDRTLKLWHLHSGTMLFTSDEQTHNTWIICVKFLPHLNECAKVFVSLDKHHVFHVWLARKEGLHGCGAVPVWSVGSIYRLNDTDFASPYTPVCDGIHRVPFPFEDKCGFYMCFTEEYAEQTVFDIQTCHVREDTRQDVQTCHVREDSRQDVKVFTSSRRIRFPHTDVHNVLAIGQKYIIVSESEYYIRVYDMWRSAELICQRCDYTCTGIKLFMEDRSWLDGFQKDRYPVCLFGFIRRNLVHRLCVQ